MKITIPLLSDWHAHLRQDRWLEVICRQTGHGLGRVQAMPNLTPPVITEQDAYDYYRQITPHLPGKQVFVTLKLTPSSTPAELRCAFTNMPDVILACKLYPGGATTNSSDGIPAPVLHNPDKHAWLGDLLEVMQAHQRVLCLHGEMPDDENPLTREISFLPFVSWVLYHFPRLRVVLEHITTREAVRFVQARPHARLAATITLHHLWCHIGHLTGCAPLMGEVNDAKIHPHLFCWPILKQPYDQQALRDVVFGGHPQFFLGSDSAPHPKTNKESSCGCAGVYTGPVLPEGLVTLFEQHDALAKLPDFTTHFGDQFYGQTRQENTITLERKPWEVQSHHSHFIPFLDGYTLPWSSGRPT